MKAAPSDCTWRGADDPGELEHIWMQVLTFADCAVNVNPTAEQLAMIACSSADTAAAFGLEPRCALLSYSTLGSGAGPDVDLVSSDARSGATLA